MYLTEKEMGKVDVEADALCKRLVELGCDSVRVVCTSVAKGGNTTVFTTGYGNFFAQLGSVEGWVRDMQETNLVHGIAEAVNTRPPEPPEPPDDDDKDNWKDG